MGSTYEAPKRDYGQETRDTLQAQVDLAPQRYAADEQFSPLYSLLNIKNLETTLKGGDGQRGLLDIYENDIAPSLAKQQQASVEGDINTVEQYGKRSADAFKAANPEQYALIQALNDQAQQELSAGGEMDPATLRQVQQSTRAGQVSRGLGYGQGDAFIEAMNVGQMAEARRRARQGFASQVVGINQATSVDPFLSLLGRSAQNSAQLQGLGGQGGAIAREGASNLFNPESGYASQLFGENASMQADASRSGASNNMAMIGGGLGLLGSLGGAWIKRN